MGWISPEDYADPSGHWVNPPHAYDEDTDSECYTWEGTDYLELYRINEAEISCNKVRIFAADSTDGTHGDPDIDIDVYYSGGWHNIWSGTITKDTWVEKPVGSTQDISKVRIKPNTLVYTYLNFYEFDFWEVEPSAYIPKVIMVT